MVEVPIRDGGSINLSPGDVRMIERAPVGSEFVFDGRTFVRGIAAVQRPGRVVLEEVSPGFRPTTTAGPAPAEFQEARQAQIQAGVVTPAPTPEPEPAQPTAGTFLDAIIDPGVRVQVPGQPAPVTQPSPFTRPGVIEVARLGPEGEVIGPQVQPTEARVITDIEDIDFFQESALGLSQAQLRVQRRAEALDRGPAGFVAATGAIAGTALAVGTVQFATGTTREFLAGGPLPAARFAGRGITETFRQTPTAAFSLIAGARVRDPVTAGLGAAGVAAPFFIARGGVRAARAAPRTITTVRGAVSPQISLALVGRTARPVSGITPARGVFVGEVRGARVQPFAGQFISGTRQVGRLDVARVFGETQFRGRAARPFEAAGISRRVNQRVNVALSRLVGGREVAGTVGVSRVRGDITGTIFRGGTLRAAGRPRRIEGVAFFRRIREPQVSRFIVGRGPREPRAPARPTAETRAEAATFSAIEKQILGESTQLTPEVLETLRAGAPIGAGAAELTVTPTIPQIEEALTGPAVTIQPREGLQVGELPASILTSRQVNRLLTGERQRPLQRQRVEQTEAELTRQISEPVSAQAQRQAQRQRTATRTTTTQINRLISPPVTPPVGLGAPPAVPPLDDDIFGRRQRRLITGGPARGRRTPSLEALIFGTTQRRRPKRVRQFTGLELRPVITRKTFRGIL